MSEIKIEYNFLLKEWEKIKPTGFSKKKRKNFKVQWYGERNFKELCNKLKIDFFEDISLYQFYELFSLEVHSVNVTKFLKNNNICDFDYSQKKYIQFVLSFLNFLMISLFLSLSKEFKIDQKNLIKLIDTNKINIYIYRKYSGFQPFDTICFDSSKDIFTRFYDR